VPVVPPSENTELIGDKPAASTLALGIDLGGGVQLLPLTGVFHARLHLAPFAHLGFLLEGGFTTTASVPVGDQRATTQAQQGVLGVTARWRERGTGPQLAALAGFEHVRASQQRIDEGFGLVFGARIEWLQTLAFGLFLRASVGVDLRPAPWPLSGAGAIAPGWSVVSPLALLSLGFGREIVWGSGPPRDTPR
jgi:hypothetical protein